MQGQKILPRKEKKLFIYDTQRNEAKIVRRDSMSTRQKTKLQRVDIPKGSRFVDVESGCEGSQSPETAQVANVNIATVEVPTRIMFERMLGHYKHLYVMWNVPTIPLDGEEE